MQIKEVIKILFDHNIKTISPIGGAEVRRIDGELVMNEKLFTFKAYSIIGIKKTIRIDIEEKEPF